MSRRTQLEKELKRATRVIVRRYHPDRVFLFGSLVHGRIHRWSDIDLAIVKPTRRRFIDRIGDVLRLVEPTTGFNAVVYTPGEVKRMKRHDHSFWADEIEKKGKVLYDRVHAVA